MVTEVSFKNFVVLNLRLSQKKKCWIKYKNDNCFSHIMKVDEKHDYKNIQSRLYEFSEALW